LNELTLAHAARGLARILLGDRFDFFALGLAALNSGGFSLAVGIPTWVDPLYESPAFGRRTYPLGWWVLIFSLILAWATYRANVTKTMGLARGLDSNRAAGKGLVSFLLTLGTGALTLANFQPELPHLLVTGVVFASAAVTGISSYIHYSTQSMDFGFIRERTISESVKLERLKTEHDVWFDALKIGITIALAAGVAFIINTALVWRDYIADAKVLRLVSIATALTGLYFIVFCFFGIFREIWIRMSRYRSQILNIRK